jgi:hypothetical protein
MGKLPTRSGLCNEITRQFGREFSDMRILVVRILEARLRRLSDHRLLVQARFPLFSQLFDTLHRLVLVSEV